MEATGQYNAQPGLPQMKEPLVPINRSFSGAQRRPGYFGKDKNSLVHVVIGTPDHLARILVTTQTTSSKEFHIVSLL
jgi:hypothetical protein